MRYFLSAYCLGAALVFAFTGVMKLISISESAVSVSKVTGLKADAAKLLTGTVASAELLTAVVLLIPRTRSLGILLSAGLFVSFVPYVAHARKVGADCGCVGKAKANKPVTSAELVRGAFFALISLLAAFLLPLHYATISITGTDALGPLVMLSALLAPGWVAPSGRHTRGLPKTPSVPSNVATPARATRPEPPVGLDRRRFLIRVGTVLGALPVLSLIGEGAAYALGTGGLPAGSPAITGGNLRYQFITTNPKYKFSTANIPPDSLLKLLASDSVASSYIDAQGLRIQPATAVAQLWTATFQGVQLTAEVLGVALGGKAFVAFSPDLSFGAGNVPRNFGLLTNPNDPQEATSGQLFWAGGNAQRSQLLDPSVTLTGSGCDTITVVLSILGLLGCSACIDSPGAVACGACAADDINFERSCLNGACLGTCYCAQFYACQAVNEAVTCTAVNSSCYQIGPTGGCSCCSCGSGGQQVCYCCYHISDNSDCGGGCCCTNAFPNCGALYSDPSLVSAGATAIASQITYAKLQQSVS